MLTRRPGWWEALVGPGAGPVESAGTVASAVAGAVLAPALARRPVGHAARLVLRVLAADLWGGAWCLNTPAGARWYGRPERGGRERSAFAAAHVHPFVVAALDPRPRFDRALAQYAYVLVATAVLGRVGHRRAAAVLATLGGLALDRWWRVSDVAPWSGPVIAVKLLAGHAGGGVLVRPVR